MKRAVACVIASLTVVAALSGPAAATHKPVRHGHHHHRPKPPAINVVRARIYSSDAWLMRLRVGDFRFRPVVAHNHIGGRRESIPNMARRTHALAGINTDAFHWARHVVPRQGFVSGGTVWKTPSTVHQANLYFTSNGKAFIGATPYTVTANGRIVHGINDDVSIENRRLTELTSNHDSMRLPHGCTVVTLGHTLPTRATGWQVLSIKPHLLRYTRIRSDHRALVACGSNDLAWVKTLRRGTHVALKFRWQVPGLGKAKITALASGVAVLVRGGKRWVDTTQYFYPRERNPETFACVSRDKRHLFLGIVDGRSTRSAGVTFNQMRRYMLNRHCWTGMVFDGGGSTIMVRNNHVLNHPSDGRPRLVPDGLFVYRRPAPKRHHRKPR